MVVWCSTMVGGLAVAVNEDRHTNALYHGWIWLYFFCLFCVCTLFSPLSLVSFRHKSAFIVTFYFYLIILYYGSIEIGKFAVYIMPIYCYIMDTNYKSDGFLLLDFSLEFAYLTRIWNSLFLLEFHSRSKMINNARKLLSFSKSFQSSCSCVGKLFFLSLRLLFTHIAHAWSGTVWLL